MNNNIVTKIKDKDGNVSEIFVKTISGTFYNIATFTAEEQFNRFCETFDVKYNECEVEQVGCVFKHTGYLNAAIYNAPLHFLTLSELPKGRRKFKALSNGSIVDCYFKRNGKNIIIYRPNPNAKEIFKPVTSDEHILHQR
jgi:hypothetical protein